MLTMPNIPKVEIPKLERSRLESRRLERPRIETPVVKRPGLERHKVSVATLFLVAFASSSFSVLLATCLATAFYFGLNGNLVGVHDFPPKSGPVAELSRQPKLDINMTVRAKDGVSGFEREKSGISASFAYKSYPGVEPSQQSSVDGQAAEFSQDSNADDAILADAATEEGLPEGIPAMLRPNASRTGIEIGNFHSASLEGDSEECLNLGYSMLRAAHANDDLMDVMVSNKQITIAKICAANGTIVFSCRSGKISISPRRARPDDSCGRA